MHQYVQHQILKSLLRSATKNFYSTPWSTSQTMCHRMWSPLQAGCTKTHLVTQRHNDLAKQPPSHPAIQPPVTEMASAGARSVRLDFHLNIETAIESMTQNCLLQTFAIQTAMIVGPRQARHAADSSWRNDR